jgi:flagellar motor switch protein FliG
MSIRKQRAEKKRAVYDKMIKRAVEILRHELAPLQSAQQTIVSQTEKNTEYLRQIWDYLDKRSPEETRGKG